MRRRIVNILCILSLLLGAAAITRCATVPYDASRTMEVVKFGTLWTITCDDKSVWASAERPPYGGRSFPRNITIEPAVWEFAVFRIT